MHLHTYNYIYNYLVTGGLESFNVSQLFGQDQLQRSVRSGPRGRVGGHDPENHWKSPGVQKKLPSGYVKIAIENGRL